MTLRFFDPHWGTYAPRATRVCVYVACAMAACAVVGQAQESPAGAELAKAKIQIVALQKANALASGQLALCQAQIAPEGYKAAVAQLDKDAAQIIADFEKTAPGWTLDQQGVAVKKDSKP